MKGQGKLVVTDVFNRPAGTIVGGASKIRFYCARNFKKPIGYAIILQQ